MDVSLWLARGICSALVLAGITLSACGNRFDLSTERGRRARMDDANFHLSRGSCDEALAAILPVYTSPAVDDEVRLVTASAYACKGTFNLLTLVGNLTNASNFFQVLAKSLANKPNDGARSAMYSAIDVLTLSGSANAASQRSRAVNSYMVFLQLATVGTIIRNYGSPATDGSQGSNLVYTTGGNPAGEMSNVDACALSAGLASIVDSYRNSNLADDDTKAVANALEGVCTSAGLASCASLNMNRTACDGTNADSVSAAAVVAGVNAGW